MHNPSAKGLLMLKNWVVIAGTAGWPSPEYAKITADFAKAFAESEFEKYRVIQDRLFQSDFDRFNGDNLIPLDIE